MIPAHCKVYNFVSYRKSIFFVSMFLCLISLIIMINIGFNWGLDFTGGFFIEIISNYHIDIVKIQDAFIQSGFKKVLIQFLDKTGNIIIRIPLMYDQDNFDQQIKSKILNVLYNNIFHEFTIQRMNWVEPSISKNITKTGIIAFLLSLLCVIIYITYRFKLKFAIGTLVSLLYNIIIVLGILSICFIEINVTVIAALISVISYSLNNNIVIFDRIRENFKYISSTLHINEIFNISLSQVLHRTIITSVTTTIVLLILLIFGGSMLYEFSITLLIGVIGGTISSIYIASVLAFYLQMKYENVIQKNK